MTAKRLDLSGPLPEEWKLFVVGLNHLGVTLYEGVDSIFRKGTKLLAKSLLKFLMRYLFSYCGFFEKWWFKKMGN